VNYVSQANLALLMAIHTDRHTVIFHKLLIDYLTLLEIVHYE